MRYRAWVPGMLMIGAVCWTACDVCIFEEVQQAIEESRTVDSLFESTAGARAITVADFNNDGLIDIASISEESQPVQVHIRNALTQLFDTSSIAGGSPLTSLLDIEAADFNRDGRVDLAVLVSDTGLSAASSQGALIFLFQVAGNDPSSPSNWLQVPAPDVQIPDKLLFKDGVVSDLVVGDIDGVKGPDLIVVASDGVRLFANPGDLEATDRTAWQPSMIESAIATAGRAALADLDHDGDLDVILGDPGARSFNLRWLQNPQIDASSGDKDAEPTYLADLVDPLFESTAGAKGVAIGDIDGDGLLDVASVSDENQPVQIHLQNAVTGKFDLYSIAGGGPLAKMTEVALDDLNGDGKLDVIVLVNDTGFVPPEGAAKPGAVVLLIQGSDPRSPSSWTQVDASTGCYVDPTGAECGLLFANDETGLTDMVVADFTGDGLPDIVVASNEPTAEDAPHTFVYLIANPGGAGVTDASAWTRTTVTSNVVPIHRIDAGDIDRDGDLDVLVGMGARTWNLSWYANIGDGSVWEFRAVGQQEGGAEHVALGDIDEDGNLDVIVSSQEFGLTQWFRNPGPAELAARVPWYVFNIGLLDEGSDTISQLRVVDLNGDGHLECFVVAGDEVVGFRREDDVEHVWDSFSVAGTDPPPAKIGLVGFADFDNDGKLDFVAPLNRDGLTDDRLTMYQSVASSQWRRRLIGQQAGGADFVAVGDIDGDGYVDVSAASAALGLTQWFRNPGAAALAYGAPQVPWNVYNIGTLSAVGGAGPITQLQLLDLDGNGTQDCFITGGGYAFEFYRQIDVHEPWGGAAIFRTDPVGQIGPVHFLDIDHLGRLDIVAPINREGLTQDQIIIFYR